MEQNTSGLLGFHLLCKRPEVFMIPRTFQNRIHFLSISMSTVGLKQEIEAISQRD